MSTGKQDYTAISTGANRRLKNRFQGGATYTLMLAMHDNGSAALVTPPANNQFDYLDGDYATSAAFHRKYVPLLDDLSAADGLSAALSYGYGSGTRSNATIATAPYGKTGSNRLNLTATGGATNAIRFRRRRSTAGTARR